MTAIGYVRVSTEEQSRDGVSVDAQTRMIESYADLRGLRLDSIIREEGVSAAKPLDQRPGGRTLLGTLSDRRAGVEALIAWKLDRLFRNAADALTVTAAWDRQGVALHLLDLGGAAVDTSSATGRLFLTMLAGMAEFERNQISERTSAAMQHLRAIGRYTGGQVPFGYRLDQDGRTLLPIPEEQGTIEQMRQLADNGDSLRAIARDLNSRGVQTRTGADWSHVAVGKILRSAELAAV